jgi:LmbE family N-acetylglucosaminyl deacetylase
MARTVLVVMAHPDDAELTCGGSIARWSREGDRVVLVVATDGARGGKKRDADARSMAETRRREAREAGKVLGVATVVFLGFPDGGLLDDEVLRGALVEQIRLVRPDVALAMDPLAVIQGNAYVNHRDHRMLGMAFLDALYPEASNPGYFAEQLEQGLETHKVPELLLVNSNQPNHWVDVTDTLDIRFDALRQHASQIGLWPENGEAVIRPQRELAAVRGVEHGVRYAEVFRRVVVNPLA